MSWLDRLFGRGSAKHEQTPTESGFLSCLSENDRVRVSNVNPLIYLFIIKEKRGEESPTIVALSDEAALPLLRKLSVAELERLRESVECGQEADRALSSDMRRAAALYKKAAELNAYNSVALLSYGVALAKLGNLKEGVKWVEKAQKVDPENDRIRRNLEAMKADL